MHGEVTMLQLYHVALTAGKAHKDHKHHHVHHFAHDGSPLPLTTPPPPSQPTPGASPNSVLVGGQIRPTLELNLAGAAQTVPAQLPNGLQINQRFVNGQFSPGRAVSEQLFNTRTQLQLQPQPPQQQLQFRPQPQGQFFDDVAPFAGFFDRSKRESPEVASLEAKKQSKRGLIALSDGSLVDDALLNDETFEQSLLSGLAGLGENLPVQNIQKEMVDEREPAEAEVKAVMDICNGCAEEPFQKALVLSWRHTPKKFFGGAYSYQAVPACKLF